MFWSIKSVFPLGSLFRKKLDQKEHFHFRFFISLAKISIKISNELLLFACEGGGLSLVSPCLRSCPCG